MNRILSIGLVAGIAGLASAGSTPIDITFEFADGTFLPPNTIVDNQYVGTQFIDFNSSAIIEVDPDGFSDTFEARAEGSFLTSATLEMSAASGRLFDSLAFDLGILDQQIVTFFFFDS